jgi:hypothetical protein
LSQLPWKKALSPASLMRFVGYFAIEQAFHPQKTAIFWAFSHKAVKISHFAVK